MPKSVPRTPPTFSALLVDAWHTCHRVTAFLVENIPAELWTESLPGSRGRTIRGLGAHVHNCRCMWVRTLGQQHGVAAPPKVDRSKVQPRQLVAALEKSGEAVSRLLLLGCEHDGRIPPSRAYVWRNLPLDVGHVLAYLVAHEAHHRGQIVLAARQLGHALPADVTTGLWQWTKRAKE